MLDRLTLDQLRVLTTVADLGSFSAAARQLHRVQSAVSQSVQSLEKTLGIALFDRQGKTPKLTDAGRVLLEDARRLVRGADELRARAESVAGGIEPELSLAVNAMFPHDVLMASLKALAAAFPLLPVTLFTEGLGAAEQRLRDGVARLAIVSLFAATEQDLETEFLAAIPLVPVAAAIHPLASEKGPLARDALARHVQLVLTDRSPISTGFSGRVVSPRVWRFADMATRLEFLLAGFGWCYMPVHLVQGHITAGRLRRLPVKDSDSRALSIPLHVAHQHGRPPARAGRWLIEDLRERLRDGGTEKPRKAAAPVARRRSNTTKSQIGA